MVKINSRGPVPKYFQLREILLDLIEGELEPEAPIPSERELAVRYGLSRMTVRQAINGLVAEGRLFRVRGRGTFVSKPKMDLQIRLTSYTEGMARRGMVPASRVLAFERTKATALLARELEITPGDPVVLFERLRYADGIPMAVERSYLPETRVPGLLDGDPPQSLYRVLAGQYGLTPTWGEQMIEAATADRDDAALLKIPAPGVVLRMIRRSYSGDVLVEYADSVYRGDRYQLWVPLERPATPITNPNAQRNQGGVS